MSTELEDLAIRVEQLEGHLQQLELRLNYDDMRHEILFAGRVTARRDGGQSTEAPDAEEGPEKGETGGGLKVARLETMVRSVLMNQGTHASDLRRAIRQLELLTHRRAGA